MEHLIAWSYHEKVFILIKDSDVENAAIPLKALLDHNGIDFETSLRIVNLLMDNLYKIDAVTGNCIRNDIYKAFMSKFQW